jgi:hypothetical protein
MDVIQMDVIRRHEKPDAPRTPGNMIITMGHRAGHPPRLVPGGAHTATPRPTGRYPPAHPSAQAHQYAQATVDPRAADWIVRAAVSVPNGVVIGPGGFHGA